LEPCNPRAIPGQTRDDDYKKQVSVEEELIRYAGYLVRRGLVCHTLGNIAIRVPDAAYPDTGVVYTKSRGISLEEMTAEDVIVTEIESDRMLAGSVPPSNGHQLARAIMACRKDVNAVIHTHPDLVVAYFSQLSEKVFSFVSMDTALVLGAPIKILPRWLNLESDTRMVNQILSDTNCFVMPTHGLTTVGRHLSEAYHRHTAFLSELHRIILAMAIKQNEHAPIVYMNDSDTQKFYSLGNQIIYGIANPNVP